MEKITKWGRGLGTVLGAIGWVIGLGGIPDDLSTWQSWMEGIERETVLRWAFIAGGTVVLYLSNKSQVDRFFRSCLARIGIAPTNEPHQGHNVFVSRPYPLTGNFESNERIGIGFQVFNGTPHAVLIETEGVSVHYGDRFVPTVEYVRLFGEIRAGEWGHFCILLRPEGDMLESIRSDFEAGSLQTIFLGDGQVWAQSDKGRHPIQLPKSVSLWKKDAWVAGDGDGSLSSVIETPIDPEFNALIPSGSGAP